MIHTCDPEIVQWSNDGKFFTIKDRCTFTSNIIPKFFKHNNLSSFIRQLNFYGFRKLRKSDSIDKNERNYIHFHHENFVRDRPDLLLQIRGSRRKILKKDESKLKSLAVEVNDMKECYTDMKNEMNSLKSLMQNMIDKLEMNESFQIKEESSHGHDIENRPKKRKIDDQFKNGLPTPSQSNQSQDTNVDKKRVNVSSLCCDNYFSDEVLDPILDVLDLKDFDFIENNFVDDKDENSTNKRSLLPTTTASLIESSSSITNDSLDSKVNFNSNIIEACRKKELTDSIAILPGNMQQLFSQKQLFSKITDPSCVQKYLDGMISLATDITKNSAENKEVSNDQLRRRNGITPRAA